MGNYPFYPFLSGALKYALIPLHASTIRLIYSKRSSLVMVFTVGAAQDYRRHFSPITGKQQKSSFHHIY